MEPNTGACSPVIPWGPQLPYDCRHRGSHQTDEIASINRSCSDENVFASSKAVHPQQQHQPMPLMEDSGVMEMHHSANTRYGQRLSHTLSSTTPAISNVPNYVSPRHPIHHISHKLSNAASVSPLSSGHDLLRLRELFAAFIGITLAFTVINFVFVNITGGCLVLFGLLSAIWCFLDRHHTTYMLNALLQLLLSITIAVAVSVYFPGFEIYSTDSVLRSISIAHVPLAFLFFLLSLYLAWIDKKPAKSTEDFHHSSVPHSSSDVPVYN